MEARKLGALALAAGLIAGSIGAAEAARRRKGSKPRRVASTSTFFLRNDSLDCAAPHFFLGLEDGEDTDCSTREHALWPVAGYTSTAYPYEEPSALVLDATRPISGVINMRSSNGAGAGNASVAVSLVGVIDGAEVTLGEWETEYLVEPSTKTFEYEIDIDDALDKKKATDLTFTVTPGGTTVGFTGVIEHDTPTSLVDVPTWVKKKK